MSSQPLVVEEWRRVILHVDADAFFVACEQATNPRLKGRPVVVGRERGIVTAASYEAKARGIKRGMRIWEVKRLCPEAIVLHSDYEKYSLFSVRLGEILREFSPQVEQYSIDEAFVDLTGLRRPSHSSYEMLGRRIQEAITTELDISVSIGISLTKVLAKIASREGKPGGLTVIRGREIHRHLERLPIAEVWGVGPNTAAWCAKLGINTALDFARRSEGFIRSHFSKPFYEIWQELNGTVVYPVRPEPKESYRSISKVRTFAPTGDRSAIYAQLSANLEDACFKARRYRLAPQRLIVLLRTQEFEERAVELRLSTACAYPIILGRFVQKGFEELYEPGRVYRQTGVMLTNLVAVRHTQTSLFEDQVQLERLERLYRAVDGLRTRLGMEVVAGGWALRGPAPADRLKIPMVNIRV
ncbi:MAG: DNA polymerase IV [candidate division WOR-3 bacterium]